MKNLRHATVGAVAGGMLSLGAFGFANAQADSTPRLDAGTVAQELELSEETQRELSPMLETLNALFERRQEHFRQGEEIRDELADTYDQIAETLSASELRKFHWLLRENVLGLGAGRATGRYVMGGRMMGGAVGGRGFGMRGGRGVYERGMPMRGARGYAGQRMPMRGTRGYDGWDVRPGWRYDDSLPNN